MTDCYQPIERVLRLTRGCLDVLAEFRNPCFIVTKNQLVTRDIDILQEMARYHGVGVFISLSSLRDDLVESLEPRTTRPERRLKTIQELSAAGVPVGVMVAPVIPGLNDHEIPSVLEAAAVAGARYANYILLRLPYVLKDIFIAYIERHFPTHKQKIIHRIQHIRGGKLNVSEFGERFRGTGIFAEQIKKMFECTARKVGLEKRGPDLHTDHFRIPHRQELLLWDETPDAQEVERD